MASLIEALRRWLTSDSEVPERGAEEASSSMNCCGRPQSSATKTGLGSARGFEFDHVTCTSCGAHWLQVYCVATSRPGFERITDQEASAMLADKSLEAHKEMMKAWADRHL